MKYPALVSLIFLLLVPAGVQAIGIRSFVALPVNKGGAVARTLGEHQAQRDINSLTGNVAYGLSGTQTLFLAVPYRLSDGEGQRLGDINLLYRHLLWSGRLTGKTLRLGAFTGVVIPTDSGRDYQLQLGGVMTAYWQRHEVDADFLWREGLGQAPDMARYDISWQYRLSPAVYPEWGIPAQWNSVVELSGRRQENNKVNHFVTAGIQRIWPQWVLEGGVSHDISGRAETSVLFSVRYHF